MFEVKLKISSLLLILFPGLQESREPGRTGRLFGLSSSQTGGKKYPKVVNTQVHGAQTLRNKRMRSLPYWIILGM